MNHGFQSESTNGPTGGWSCVFWSGCNGCSGHRTTTVGCSMVECSCSCSCGVVLLVKCIVVYCIVL